MLMSRPHPTAGRGRASQPPARGPSRIGTALREGHARGTPSRPGHRRSPRADCRRRSGPRQDWAMNLSDLLVATTARHADRPAVTDIRVGRTLTYGQLASEAERVAVFLRARSRGRSADWATRTEQPGILPRRLRPPRCRGVPGSRGRDRLALERCGGPWLSGRAEARRQAGGPRRCAAHCWSLRGIHLRLGAPGRFGAGRPRQPEPCLPLHVGHNRPVERRRAFPRSDAGPCGVGGPSLTLHRGRLCPLGLAPCVPLRGQPGRFGHVLHHAMVRTSTFPRIRQDR
jgi:hypothetical protein